MDWTRPGNSGETRSQPMLLGRPRPTGWADPSGDTIIRVITGAIWLETLLIIASVIVSWLPIRQWHPAIRALHVVVDPVLRPFRRILPTIAGFDFSPLLAILVLQAVSTLVSSLALGSRLASLAALVSVVAKLVLA